MAVEMVFYFIVTLGVLVFVHEFGHFIAAKMCGMRVERFSIGFPPRAFGKQIGETDYCVSWIPIGGYVKISGMIDESFDTEHVGKEPQPWEFRSKPIWQRMIVISAGVIMNVLLAVVIFWGINYMQGKTIMDTTEIGSVADGSPAASAGLQPGDRIIAVNDSPVSHWDEILSRIYLDFSLHDLTFTVVRSGGTVQAFVARQEIPDFDKGSFGFEPAHTDIVIIEVQAGKPAAELGLQLRDIIVGLDGKRSLNSRSINQIIRSHAGVPLYIEWKRGDELMSGIITPGTDSLIGIGFRARYSGPVTKVDFTFFEALPEGIKQIGGATALLFQHLGELITGKRAFAQSVGGPIKIAQLATQTAEMGLITYLGFMALLSISLAVLNILPIPALDGGHLLFLIYEGIFRREIPVKVKLGLQKAGFAILLAFMVFVVYNDIVNF